MAKQKKVSPEETLKKIAVLLVEAGITAETEASDESADEATETDEPTEVDMPDTPEGIKELSADEAKSLATSLGLEIDGLNSKQITNLLLSINKITSDEELTEKEANALAKAVGAKPGKTVEKTVAALKEYFVADESEESDESDDSDDSEEESDEEDSDEEESDEEESDDEESDEEESDDEESDDEESEESDEEESDDESDEEESDDEESDDEESDEEESDEESDEEESDDEEEAEEVSEDDMLKAYNKVAKKKLKKFDALKELLTDDEGDVADWGVPYSKNEEVYCCGMPLKDVKIKQGKKTVDGGKCQVTGKQFVQDSEGNFEEVE